MVWLEIVRRVNALWPRRTVARWLSISSQRSVEVARAISSRIAFDPASIAAICIGAAKSAPDVRQSVRRVVAGAADAQVRGDPLAKLVIHGGNTGFAVDVDESLAARK